MKKTDAIKLFNSAANLARALGVSESAVSQWAEDVPEKHELRIRYELKPDYFEPAKVANG